MKTNITDLASMDSQIQVRQHNAITNARFDYSAFQMDIFLFLLANLRKEQADGVYEISVPAMTKLTGTQYNYQQMRLATEGMGSRMFEISDEIDKKGRHVWRQMWMFERVDYIHNTGIIEIQFTRTIQPYLFDLQSNFTSFELYSALKLNSKHAKRIYAMCSQWKDKEQTPKYTIEDFKRAIGLINDKGEEEYTEITMFKKRVLDEAVRQINEHSDLEIGYTLEKKGRSFKNVTFSIKRQAIAAVLPTGTEQTGQGAVPAGVTDFQYQNVRLLLEKWAIKLPEHVNQIMNSAQLIQEVNKFAHELQTGKVVVKSSISGYLLRRLGLVKTAKIEPKP